MKRVLISFVIIGVIAVTAIGLTNAFFSDSETSSGNIFQAGIFDLLVDGQNDPIAIVDVDDLKPGDDIFEDKILTIQNLGNVWLHLIEYESGQGVQTEPENAEENGTPKHDLENYLTYDLKIDEDVIIHFDDEILFPDVFSCWIPLGEIPAGDTTVEQSFHFDEGVTNWAQGDTLTFTEEFYAEQLSNNPNASPPDLENGRTWSSELKKCVSDLIGQHLLTFTCTSGCSGDYPHTMNVILMDTATGVFSGDGFYNPNAGYTWDVSGNTAGSTISFHILYTGIGAGYTVDAIGTMNLNGTSFGSATSSSGQVFTWIMD